MSTTQSTTKSFVEEILSETFDIVLSAKSQEDHVGRSLRQHVNEPTDIITDLLESQEHFVVLDAPSKPAMQGDISLTGETGATIRCSRPSEGLVREFRKVMNLAGLENLWCPSSLVAWSFEIIKRYVMRHSYDSLPPEVLLSLARFGEAQLAGASEEVMYLVLEDFKAGRYRTYQQWRKIVVGDRTVQESHTSDFNGDMVRFTVPGPDGDDEFLLHELEFPFYAQVALQHAQEHLDNLTSWKMRKMHYQAFDKMVDVKNLKHDGMACPICLMEFENAIVDKGEKQCVPQYDVTEDNRQAIKLTCGHVFGTTCIEKWLSDNKSCPLCRTTLLGRGRKLKPISQQRLSTITTYIEGQVLLYYEDMEFDQSLHTKIAEAVQNGHIFAWTSLKSQFQSLREIDSRLGIPKRNSKDHAKTYFLIAPWMDEDWDKFATNALALCEYVKDYIRSNPDWTIDPLARDIKRNLAMMLHAHRQRSQL